jgi:tRNA 2-thiocytidine biosynthesis protein TtcA
MKEFSRSAVMELIQIHDPSPARVLRRDLARTMTRTLSGWDLLRAGDRVLVAVSGGKDSYTLVDLLEEARRRAPFPFEIVAFHLDQAQPGHDAEPLRRWLESHEIPFEIHREDTYSAVIANAEETDQRTYCRLCSRLRRGILYTAAERLGCGVIALGHHRDDSLETFLLNLLYAGRLQAMPPGYVTNDSKFRVIRPLVECSEADILGWSDEAQYPILPCRLCGSQDDRKRARVERLMADLEGEIPDVRSVMAAALANVRPSHLHDREVAEAWEEAAARYSPRR